MDYVMGCEDCSDSQHCENYSVFDRHVVKDGSCQAFKANDFAKEQFKAE